MALHPLYREIATDLTQQVFEARRLRGELGLQALDSQNRRLYPIPSAIVQREAFIADRDSTEPDTEIVPVWHFRGRKRKG